MVTFENFRAYLAEKNRVPIYDSEGELYCVCFAVRKDICQKIREFNSEWEEEYPGLPLYLFPEHKWYPKDLLDAKNLVFTPVLRIETAVVCSRLQADFRRKHSACGE